MVLALEREPRQKRQWGRVVARAWDDEAFRRRLLAEPASVLCEEGIEVPAGVAVRVVEGDVAESAEDEPCFWLPPSPAADDDVADDLGLPPEGSKAIVRTGNRTKPAPVARLPLPNRPAADDLTADDLGLPPDTCDISFPTHGRTKPAPVARLSLPARPAADDLIADDLGLPPEAVAITRSGNKTFTKPR
jgi:hypothetical protein